jgi:putative DNA primase/helicase
MKIMPFATAGTTDHVEPWQRFTKTHRCRVCGGYDSLPQGKGVRCFGYISKDKTRAFCTRENHAGDLGMSEGSSTFTHHLDALCPCGKVHEEIPPDPTEVMMTAEPIPQFDPDDAYAAYDYEDEDGTVLFQVRRYETAGGGKTFLQYRPDGEGGWISGTKGVKKVLYRLPRVVEAIKAGERIFVVEGEKDVHAIEKAGGVATCNPGGADQWQPAYSLALKGANLVLVRDNDKAGRRHMKKVKASVAVDSNTCMLVEAKTGKDAFDHLDAGYGLDDFVEVTAPQEPLPLTDLGNAERFVRDHGDYVRFVVPWRKWIVYRKNRWKLDERNHAKYYAHRTVRGIYGEAEKELDEQLRKRISKHATKSEGSARIQAMLKEAEGQKGYKILPAKLDIDDYLLNLKNGTLDLHTGELRPSDPADLISKLAPVTWAKSHESPLWDSFLQRVLPDPEVRSFFQRAVGYTLTGDMTAHAFFFVYGPTASGKSTAMGAIKEMLGDYAATTSTEAFLSKHFSGGGNTPELAKLPGVRMVLMSELPPNKSFNAPLIKQWTGGDELQATAKYQDPFEFKPKGKLWFTANDRPHVAVEDEAFWRRTYLIPFDVTIPKDEQNPKLKLQLEEPEARSAILAWAYEGLVAFQDQGLNPPEAVLAAVEDYQEEVDPVGDFIEERCIFADELVTTKTELYASYCEYAKDAGIKYPVSKNRFGKILRQRGLQEMKLKKQRAWRGIGLAGGGVLSPGSHSGGMPVSSSEL